DRRVPVRLLHRLDRVLRHGVRRRSGPDVRAPTRVRRPRTPGGDRPMTAAIRLAELIACRTVSAPDERDESQFVAFRETFARLYPRLHADLELTRFDGGSLLFRWSGRRAERPLVLMAHYDV